MKNAVLVDRLSDADLVLHPVWRFANHAGSDDLAVVPVRSVPVANTTGKLFATRLLLADGSSAWGMLGNVDGTNPELTRHFLTLSVLRNDKWFSLARYHDIQRADYGPEQLAEFLGQTVEAVFPIRYDISGLARGSVDALRNLIPAEPENRLTRMEIIALAVG